MNHKRQLTVDGITYTVELHWGGDVVWIYDAQGNRVADAERDTAVEQVFVHYGDAEGQIDDASTEAPREFYDLNWRTDLDTFATWLVSTHPQHA